MKHLRTVLCFLLVLFHFGLNQALMAESEAEIRANARILQDRIDAENERIEKEAKAIYYQKTRSPKSQSSKLDDSLDNLFIGSICIGIPVIIWLSVMYLMLKDTFFFWFDMLVGLFGIMKCFDRGHPKRSSESEYDDYLSELRTPLIQIPQKTLSDRVENAAETIKININKFTSAAKLNPEKGGHKKRDNTTTLFSCARCGESIKTSNLEDKSIYCCPHCNKYLRFTCESGFSTIKTNPCCICRQPIIVDDLTMNTPCDCPHCSNKIWYRGGGSYRKTGFTKM